MKGKGHKAAAIAKRKEEQDARKADTAQRRTLTQEKRKMMVDNKAAKERAGLEKLMAKIEEAKKKTTEADKISTSFTTDAFTKENKLYLAAAESAQLRHRGKKTKAADESANVGGQLMGEGRPCHHQSGKASSVFPRRCLS